MSRLKVGAIMSNQEDGWNPARPGHKLISDLVEQTELSGQLSVEEIAEMAEQHGTSPAKVRGVIGYYTDLQTEETDIKICTGEACRSRGAQGLIDEYKLSGKRVGKLHCAGRCASGPAIVGSFSPPISTKGDGLKFFISGDCISRDLGSDEVASAIMSSLNDCTIVRTGSRGLFHLEPMIELETGKGRIGYGPVNPSDVGAILTSINNYDFDSHPLFLGPIQELSELSSQTRFAMARLGCVAPLDLVGNEQLGAYQGLVRAVELGGKGVLNQLKTAGLRGRGGAGFPTHFKWGAAANENSTTKYVVANADEGDAGTFIDRMIMEGDPHGLIEGMVICAKTIGATKGFVYLRNEYPDAKRILQDAIHQAENRGILGPDFSIEIATGAGSYVCGEETALLESLEGRRGEVRARPPYPTTHGLFGEPTIVNNVLTFAIAAAILREGAEVYGALGTERSKGTVVAQIVGATGKPTCIEVPFGGTLEELFTNYSSLEDVTALQIGGPLGSVFMREELIDIELSFEGLSDAGGLLGHGGFVCYDDTFDPRAEVLEWMTFFRDESCGKCTPCRIGTQRSLELLTRIGTSNEKPGDQSLLSDLDDVMTSTSLCALGGLAMNPVRSTMIRWPSAFGGDSHE